jgi:hypothetical protein
MEENPKIVLSFPLYVQKRKDPILSMPDGQTIHGWLKHQPFISHHLGAFMSKIRV